MCTISFGGLVANSVFTHATADAAITHEFLEPLTKELSKGVPAESKAPLTGRLSLVNALTVDSQHLWAAETVERAGKPVGTRVDEFNDSTGMFMRQLNEEGGVGSLESGIAVGHPAGEEEVYVGAANKGNVVAVFGPSGKLQSEGVWSGKNTPTGSFGELKGLAVSGNVGLTQNDVYVATSAQATECEASFKEGKPNCVVDVFPGQAGGKEPAKVLGQLTGTCENPGEVLPCAPGKLVPFARPDGVAVSAVSGDVFVADGNGGVCGEGLEPACGIDVFEPSGAPGVYSFLFRVMGAPGEPFKRLGPMAVDGEGDFYVVEKGATEIGSEFAHVVDQFNAAGKFVDQIKGPGSEVPFKRLQSVAADPVSGNVYVGDFDTARRTGSVDAFGPSRIIPDVTTSATSAKEVTVTSTGQIEATLTGTINPLNQGEARCWFVWGDTKAFGAREPCQPEGVPNGSVAVPVKATIRDLAPGTTYFFRLQASNTNGTNPGEESQDRELLTPGAGIRGESAAEVSATSATLGATIDPNGTSASYYFQYGRSTSYESQAPAAPGVPLGSGGSDVRVAPQHIQSLEPDTVYHYRVVAVSQLEVEGTSKEVSFDGPDQTFTTLEASGEGALPDGRQWELVSPPDKHGALLESIEETGVIQASASGAAVAYLATEPTEEGVKGYIVEGVQVMSVRGAESWSSHDISLSHVTPPGLPLNLGKEYRFFSSDLSLALVQPLGEFSSLAPEAFPPDTERTPYVRHNDTCAATPTTCFQPLVTGAPGYADVPEGTKFGGNPESSEREQHYEGEARFVGASSDLAHVILSSKVALTTTPTGGAEELYEWSAGRPAGERLQLLSVLPSNEKGEELPAKIGHLGFQGEVARHAVSEDGSHVVWSDGVNLYMHDLTTGKTVQLDVPEAQCQAEEECGAGQTASPRFQLASSDGSRVLFSDTQELTRNAGKTPGTADLYACEMVEEAGKLQCKLSDLTPSPGPSEVADVQRVVIGASEDGSWVYFVANGVLGDAGEHGASTGDCREEANEVVGVCNLYVYHGGSTHFIAALAGEDNPDWAGHGETLNGLTARVSPDGRWLAFMSSRSLTGYDNRDAVSGKADEEVFLYHAEAGAAGSLVCASCDPSGARPVGVEYRQLNGGLVGGDRTWTPQTWIAANVPGWTPYELSHALYQSRYLSDSGRLFFDSGDALVAQDINGNQDVYEYEPTGVGDCSSVSPTFHATPAGCVALISSGRAAGESAFVDASESGDDVFFLTAERLVPQDVDSAIDLYDAHACSAGAPCFEEADEPPPCATADSCRAAPSPQPSVFGSSPSGTIAGQGNLAPPTPTKKPPLTRAQQLAKALRACRGKHEKKHRAACERQARKRYGPKPPRKAHARGRRSR